MVGLLELMKTEEYAAAWKKVDAWEARLKGADASAARQIWEEKNAFFSDMKKRKGGLYALFQLEDKILSEKIVKKVSGKDIILD